MRFFPILLVTILLGLRDPITEAVWGIARRGNRPTASRSGGPAQWRGIFETIFLIDNNGREAVKCAQTDSNQAEDICPARFFATSEPANHRIDLAGKRKEES